MKPLALLVIVLILVSCSTQTLVGTHEGRTIGTKKNLKKSESPPVREFKFDRMSPDSKTLRLSVTDVVDVREDWEDEYEKINEYRNTPTGLSRFAYGWVGSSISESNETKSDGTLLKPNLQVKQVYYPVTAKNAKITINGKTTELSIENGVSTITLSKLNIDSKKLPEDAKATITIDNHETDVSNELRSLASEEAQKREQQRVLDAQQKYEVSCRAGISTACDRLNMPIEKTDLAAFLSLESGQFLKIKTLTLYTGSSFEAIQKTSDGYLFTVNRNYFRGGAYGMALLKTSASLSSGVPLCGYFYYVGPYRYTALDGFEKSVPSFRVFNGTPPILNPNCDTQITGSLNPGGRVTDH